MAGRKSRNWWCMLWPKTEEEALAWKPADKPKHKYVCWRVHRCPTTKRIHIHILFQFTTVVRFETLEKKGFNNIKWVEGQDRLERKRNYCIEEVHRKDNTPKGVISDFMEVGEWIERSSQKTKRDEVYKHAFSKELSFREGISIIRDNCARDFAIHGETIEKNLRRTRPKKTIVKYTLEDFNIPPIDFEEKAVLIWGKTNSGKTHFAKAHFSNPLVASQMEDLHNLGEEHDGIVFDDMSFVKWPPNSVIHLLDWDEDRSLYSRYRNVHIPANTRKIFTYNTENPFYEPFIPEEQREAIERRLKRINVTEQLF